MQKMQKMKRKMDWFLADFAVFAFGFCALKRKKDRKTN